jgi:hypothetical protein
MKEKSGVRRSGAKVTDFGLPDDGKVNIGHILHLITLSEF